MCSKSEIFTESQLNGINFESCIWRQPHLSLWLGFCCIQQDWSIQRRRQLWQRQWAASQTSSPRRRRWMVLQIKEARGMEPWSVMRSATPPHNPGKQEASRSIFRFTEKPTLVWISSFKRSCHCVLFDPWWHPWVTPLGSSIHGILQARMLEWVVISSSRGSSRPRDWTCISCIGRQILYHWDT